MIKNPNRYNQTRRFLPAQIEERLNTLYRMINDYEISFSIDADQAISLSIIKDNINEAHSYFTQQLREVAIINKKFRSEY
jgi:hypothetical protein